MIEFEYISMLYHILQNPYVTRYLYNFGNYQEFVAELLEDEWNQLFFEAVSVDDMWMYFHNIFTALVTKYIPTSSTYIHIKNNPE